MQSAPFFQSLNLQHAGTRRRVQHLLDHVDLQRTYTRKELWLLCGQPNKALGRTLHLAFYQLPTIADRKVGGTNAYRAHAPSIDELRALLSYVERDEAA